MHRGETFRKEFSHLGEVRSLIPEAVNIMALTATATKTTRREVSRSLGLVHPAVVAVPPNKPNIKYCINANPSDLEEIFAPLVEELREKRTCMERTIIFCLTNKDCSAIYMFMVDQLGKEMMEPISTCPDLPQYRLLDMFCACTHVTVKNSILQSITEPTSTLRIVIATIAFGMGLDCPNIRRIIHWGPSSDVEMYLQETGRAGHDGQLAVATLYCTKADLLHTSDDMKEYCRNQDTCRRTLLLRDFDMTSSPSAVDESSIQSLCSCCDVCEVKCTYACSTCKPSL